MLWLNDYRCKWKVFIKQWFVFQLFIVVKHFNTLMLFLLQLALIWFSTDNVKWKVVSVFRSSVFYSIPQVHNFQYSIYYIFFNNAQNVKPVFLRNPTYCQIILALEQITLPLALSVFYFISIVMEYKWKSDITDPHQQQWSRLFTFPCQLF